MLKQKPSQSCSGFSLIELVIAIAILTMAILFGLPGISQWMQNSQLRTAAENIRNGLEYARMEAVRGNMPVEFKLANPGVTGGTGWSVKVVRTGTVVQAKPDGEATASAIVTTSPSGAKTVTFTGLGRRQASNADGTTVMTQIDIDSSSLSSADSRNLRITISTGGEIRMCDPNVSETGDPRRC